MRAKRKKTYERHNVWRSYSDMMAGLLLLFLLVMCISFMQAQKNYQDRLDEESAHAEEQSLLQAQLDEKEALLLEQESELDEQTALLAAQQESLNVQSVLMAEQESELAEQAALVASQQASLDEQSALMAEQESELEEQAALVASQQASLDEQSALMAEQESELEEQAALVAAQQASIEEQEALLTAQQEKIEQIIGVKADLIAALKAEFAAQNLSVTIDDDGSIVLDSSVLFGYNENILTEEGSKLLGELLPTYCSVLLSAEYVDYLAEIRVDGYTDTSGSYYYNLQLSQSRALAVAEYLLSLAGSSISTEDMEDLQEKLSVNGHSWADPIYNEDGTENAEASRRVEIKFRLKDEEMINELKDILDEAS